jgi:integrase
VLVVTLLRNGSHAEAVAMLLAFHCYLRVGELTRLRLCDFVLPGEMGRAHGRMAVCIPLAKTGRNQWVTLADAAIASVVCGWLSRRRRVSPADSTRVFPFTPDHLRQMMQRACAVTGVSATPYVPHSLRHGGATHDYLLGASIEQIMDRGRWRGMDSAKTYLQTGRVLLASQHLPASLVRLGADYDAVLAPLVLQLMDSVPLVAPPRRRGGDSQQ